MLKIVALISGGGSILKALLDACEENDFPARVVAVGSDTDAAGLEHAKKLGINTFIVRPRDFSSREEWGGALLAEIRSHGVGTSERGLIVSAGLMRILPGEFVAEAAPFLINTHPSLLPNFPGATAVADALAAGAKETGVTVHIVDSGVDTGPVIRQAKLEIHEGEAEAGLHERIKQLERPLLVDVVQEIATGKIDLKKINSSR